MSCGPRGPVGDIGVSVRRAAVGLALGAGVGLVLGIVVGLTRLGEELLDSSMQMLRMVPYPAVIFLFIIWFGIGETAKVLLIGLATLFPMYLNTSNGVRNVDRRSSRRPASSASTAGDWSARSSSRWPCRPSSPASASPPGSR